MRRAAAVLLASVAWGPRIGAQGVPAPLDRRVTLELRAAPIEEGLLRLRAQGVALAWRGDQLPSGPRRSLSRRDAPVGEVLGLLIAGSGLEVRVTTAGVIVLVPRAAPAAADAQALLATGVQSLDQLVVTGSPVEPLPRRDQPTAITVVRGADLRASPHRRLGDAVRAFLPGLVLWDRGGPGPPPVPGGVRGVASFTARAPKLYVDGVEVASSELFTLLDPRGIARIEMIHGPQGAALYGPDALSGVIQIETARGEAGDVHPSPYAAAQGGVLVRDLDGTSAWRDGAAGLAAGGQAASFAVLGSATRLATDAAPADAWRLQGGGRWSVGRWRIDASARAARHEAPIERVLPLADAQAVRGSQPLEERGFGVRVAQSLGAHLTQVLVAGFHRISGSREPFRSPILPPRLPLGATNERATRASARYAASYERSRLTLATGVEWSHRLVDRSARLADGSADLSALYREALDATGAFVQARMRLGPVVLSGGARTDRISSVGAEAATPWAATTGAAWTIPLGSATVALRGAWGRALRPPEPGMRQALAAGTIRQEANAGLRAESQRGIELGGELHLATGAWFRATWFRQRAVDLLQQVDLRRPSGGTRYYQFQNVGAITNRGIELDGGFTMGRFAAAARAAFVSSRVAELAPQYTGEFSPGDPPLEVPASSGSLALRYATGGARLELGGTWLGPWTGYDWRLVYRVQAGQAPARDGARDYWLRYDAVVRPFVGATVPIAGDLALLARAEWPLGEAVSLRDNLAPALGRTLMIGLEFGR